jgi:hypothetical protein
MPSDVSIVVADAARLQSIRERSSLPGRMMPFPSSSIASALASVRAYRPRVIAIEAAFAETPAGVSFIEQIEPLTRGGSSILLLVEHEDTWVATPHGSGRAPSQSSRAAANTAKPTVVAASKPAAAPASNTIVAATPSVVVSTRRAPRFQVRDQLEVVVESGHASLVDLSVLGAQIVSLPMLRPNQKIKIDLTDPDETLSVIAQVAWALFERPQLKEEPFYRVGLEFTGAAQKALEQYRQRHCDVRPIAQRNR